MQLLPKSGAPGHWRLGSDVHPNGSKYHYGRYLVFGSLEYFLLWYLDPFGHVYDFDPMVVFGFGVFGFIGYLGPN